MNNNLEEKINLIRKANTDDSNFILKIYETYQNHKKDLENKTNSTSIILKDNFINSFPVIVDLDKIWAKPYFYTKMRLHLDGIINKISNTNISIISKNPSKFCKNISIANYSKTFKKLEDEIDIVDFIKILNKKKSETPDYNTSLVFIAQEINEETLFKEEQLRKAVEVINIDSQEKQYEKIYDEVYSYLKKDFIANNYCDFKNNKCVSQRHFSPYYFKRKNGCCYTSWGSCKHLQKSGVCDTQCIACRLFSCPYLTKRGITYYASEFVLLKAFLTKKQRKHIVFDFYKPKSYVLKKLLTHNT